MLGVCSGFWCEHACRGTTLTRNVTTSEFSRTYGSLIAAHLHPLPASSRPTLTMRVDPTAPVPPTPTTPPPSNALPQAYLDRLAEEAALSASQRERRAHSDAVLGPGSWRTVEIRPHRCHGHLDDTIYNLAALQGWSALRDTFGRLVQCYRSTPGEEPERSVYRQPPEYDV
ncbi:hypothetical protein CXG81DRAFT_20593 [Caulochytrium protostelioides]|uniref:Uncharacterized protein n=1 Tax=Caulochytrium protostelioides TaxID=1555241 RepID=A0A4P9X2V1_9FUNG|nr:hypothetical protein CXG81DRAFT_20593 [Caulochytrium protostelioides]|eukprot:RKO99320.1 hypothetical protein CXG81DRAFT_20593 [Caulochytrium protostelioides]